MCKWIKELFSRNKSNVLVSQSQPKNYSRYISQYMIYEIGLSSKTIRHDDLASLLHYDADLLHQQLLPPFCTSFKHYVDWGNGVWRWYIEGKFPLSPGMIEFVGIDASNIAMIKQIIPCNERMLQVLADVERALK